MKVYLYLDVLTLLIALSISLVACGGQGYADTFPTHAEPLPTDWGRGDHIMVDLVVEDGCLRANGPSPSYLLIWPEDFTLSQTSDPSIIYDRDGRSAVRVGDMVRFSGRLIDPDSDHAREIADSVPKKCPGPYYLVGDEVNAIPSDESEIVSVPRSSLYFQRKKTRKWKGPVEDTLELPSGPFELIQDGSCLVINYSGEKVLPQWPAGFYPRISEDGVIEIRNGGGRTIARVGDKLLMRGTTLGGSHIPECDARLWNVKDVRNTSLSIVFTKYDGERDYPVSNSIKGYMEARNGCLYILGHILIWPSDFTMNRTDDYIQVLNDDNRIVGEAQVDDPIGSRQRVSFKGRRVNQDDDLGRQIRRTLPIDCPHGDFWFVD